MKLIIFLIFSFPLIGFSDFGFAQPSIEFSWVESIDDDFSFTEEWQYEEGVYLNRWGQLSCDGFCPMEIDRMKDDQGRIYDDSLASFYSIIDTTHHYYTHQGEVRAYEFGECHYASAREENGKILVETGVNIATHTYLHMELDSNIEPKLLPKAWLNYNSIRSIKGPVNFNALRGKIEISKSAYDKGIIQMRFDLKFENGSTEDDRDLSWKGLILVEMFE